MSFEELSVEELKIVADAFAVESKSKSKAALVKAIDESGVRWEDYLSMFKPDWKSEDGQEDTIEQKDVKEEEINTQTKKTEKILVKMDRDNPLFEWGGYRFTASHPYVLMEAEDAQRILSANLNFRQAWPDEVEEYYS